jgi:transcription-repair coupling factor (superfamily II helicase)
VNLGSGFIAMKDLEIRAGDLLGGEQSGLSMK